MRPLLAIAQLTWKAAFRYRLVWVLLGLLLASVILLPIMVKDDGTARGFVQILLTYTLGVISFLLGLATLWLSCGTMARDMEECQIQMVAVKPVARWQIWVGKWIGVISLNAVLLAASGLAVYVLLNWRAGSLPPKQQLALREEILVSRASFKPKMPDLESMIRKEFNKVPNIDAMSPEQRGEIWQKEGERVYARAQLLPPHQARAWDFDLGFAAAHLGNQPLFVRFKFYAATTNEGGLYLGNWAFAAPGSTELNETPVMRMAPDSFQEFQVPNSVLDSQGRVQIIFQSQDNITLLFPLDEAVEVLYRNGGFGLNFARGLGIILAWLALLSALGLAAASVTSFPVAAFCSISLLVVMLSSGTLAESVQNQNVIGGAPGEFDMVRPVLNAVLLPLFRGILATIRWIEVASPVELLSTGRSITWGLLGSAWLQIVVIAGGLLALIGTTLLTRRELATAQGNQ